MKTIKGNQKDIIKEYKKYCKDLALIPFYIINKNLFVKNYIENEIKTNGLYYNEKFKTVDVAEVHDELLKILDKKIRIA